MRQNLCKRMSKSIGFSRHGCRLHCTLPLSPFVRQSAGRLAMMPKSTLKIALLESGSQCRTEQARAYTASDFICTRYTTETDFRLSFCKNHFDAVLVACDDCSEPQTRAMVAWIRSVRCSNIPLMVLCENYDEGATADTLYAGADDVQTLPIIPNVLRARLTALCSRVNIGATKRSGNDCYAD